MIAYTTLGSKDKPAVLFLHGFLSNRYEWFDLMNDMKNHYYCIAVDLPGHGETPIHANNATFFQAGEEINQLLDSLNIMKCHLIAYSMGGRFALQLISQRSHRYLSCLLESSSPGLKTEEEREQRIKMDEYIARQIEKEGNDFRGYLIKWYSQSFFKFLKQDKELFEKILTIRLKNDPYAMAESLRHYGAGRQPSFWKFLPDITCWMFLVCGLHDKKFVDISRELALHCPFVHMIIVSDCGHNVHMEKPQYYSEMVFNFLKNDL